MPPSPVPSSTVASDRTPGGAAMPPPLVPGTGVVAGLAVVDGAPGRPAAGLVVVVAPAVPPAAVVAGTSAGSSGAAFSANSGRGSRLARSRPSSPPTAQPPSNSTADK